MCGIIGYYQKGGLTADDLHRALAALSTMQHRGPDGEGVLLFNSESGQSWSLRTPETPSDISTDLLPENYQDRQADFFLAHRRLSIFDLSSRGHQPMRDQAGNALCFNGEVYNFPELREELSKLGHTFQSESDTEVIMAAYRSWGPDALRRFNGMWSLLLFDPAKRQLLVSSDRIGIKQLYRYADGESLILASEIKAIRALREDRLSLNQEGIRFFLDNGQIDYSPATLHQEIRRFQPAHYSYGSLSDQAANKVEPQRYWDFPTNRRRFSSLDEAAEALRELIDDAIRLRMRSDVPWGTTLSGGLDSSSIVYAAHGLRKKMGMDGKINSFTAIFPGKSGDESKFARIIEKDLGLNAQYTNPLEVFDFDDFERFLQHQDQPVPHTSMYAQWSVMKMVGTSNVKVLLDGQGGDELFAGYHHHLYKYARDLMLRGKIGKANRTIEAFCEMRGFDPATIKGYVRNDLKLYMKLKMGHKMPGPAEATLWNKARNLSDVLQLDITSWVMPSLLRYEDRNSMAFGIEARIPLLDYRIVELAFQLPSEYKIHGPWQKYVLRQAMPELPEEIRFRKDKKGFSTPHEEWMTTYRERFLSYAKEAVAAGIKPQGGKKIEDLNNLHLFRMAGMGFWMGK
jgi:asparagine synthase (glutamine-hydrolysing)